MRAGVMFSIKTNPRRTPSGHPGCILFGPTPTPKSRGIPSTASTLPHGVAGARRGGAVAVAHHEARVQQPRSKGARGGSRGDGSRRPLSVSGPVKKAHDLPTHMHTYIHIYIYTYIYIYMCMYIYIIYILCVHSPTIERSHVATTIFAVQVVIV